MKKEMLIPNIQPGFDDPQLFLSEENGKRIVEYYLYDNDESIGDPGKYTQFINAIDNLHSGDEVLFHINSHGGSLDSSSMIFECLSESDANITMFVDGACCSGASMILMAGDEFVFSRGAYIMVHTWSGGLLGKSSDIMRQVDFEKAWWEKLFTSIYSGFLTDDEMKACIVDGKDFWFDAEEALRRIENSRLERLSHQQLINSIAEKYQTEINKEIHECFDDEGKFTEKGRKLFESLKVDENDCSCNCEKKTKSKKNKDK